MLSAPSIARDYCDDVLGDTVVGGVEGAVAACNCWWDVDRKQGAKRGAAIGGSVGAIDGLVEGSIQADRCHRHLEDAYITRDIEDELEDNLIGDEIVRREIEREIIDSEIEADIDHGWGVDN